MALSGQASALAASAAGGYWQIDGRLAGHGIHLICHLDQQAGALHGLCFGDGAPATGSVDGALVSWRWKTHGHVLTFEGLQQTPDLMSGKIKTTALAGVTVTGSFTAERRPLAKDASAEPAGLAPLRQVIADLARGQLSAESCTAELAEGLRKQMSALQPIYSELGALKELTFVARMQEPSDRVATEVYEAHFENAARVCSIDVTRDGKISNLICKPL